MKRDEPSDEEESTADIFTDGGIDRVLPGVLNSAGDGELLASEIIKALKMTRRYVLDFSAVQRVTPSYANALVMTLLGQFSPEVLRKNVPCLGMAKHVESSIEESFARYARGIRLSVQQATPRGRPRKSPVAGRKAS